MRKFPAAFLLAILCLPVWVFPQFKLGILGSSTAAGTGADADSGWVALVTQHYTALGLLSETVNLAVGGTNPYHAMPTGYVPPAGRPSPTENNVNAMIAHDPDVVIVSFVSNDYPTYSYEEIRFTLDSIRAGLMQAGIVVYITTTQPRTGFNAANRQMLANLKDSIIGWYGEFAINFFDDLVDPNNLSILPEYRYAGDNVHINNAGHRVLFENVVEKNIFAPLLVQLHSFKLIQRNEKPLLVWEVSYEEADTRYAIEYSSDCINFSEIYILHGSGEAGKKIYSYQPQVWSKENYFRLHVTESARAYYSGIVKFVAENHHTSFKIFPNPASEKLTVVIDPDMQFRMISIVDVHGRQVMNRRVSTDTFSLDLDLSALPKGMYMLRAVAPRGSYVWQLIIR